MIASEGEHQILLVKVIDRNIGTVICRMINHVVVLTLLCNVGEVETTSVS